MGSCQGTRGNRPQTIVFSNIHASSINASCSLYQIPSVLTVKRSEWMNQLPLEFAGWWIRKTVSVTPAVPEFLVVSRSPTLAISLAVRGPRDMNVVWGHSSYNASEMGILKKAVGQLQAPIKRMSALLAVQWVQGWFQFNDSSSLH